MKLVLHKPLFRHQYQMEYRYYLGFGYLKAFVNQELPEVDVHVAHSEAEIRDARPDVIGFSTVTEMWPHVLGMYQRLRSWFDGPVLFGGPHISALPELLPRGRTIGFKGEGELALVRVLERLMMQRGRAPRRRETRGATLPLAGAVPGTFYWDGDRLVSGGDPETVDINLLPEPADAPTAVFPFTTVRGCPFRCTHCVEPATQGRVRIMTPQRFVDLCLSRYERYGTTVFELLDDLFLVSPKRLFEMVDLLESRGVADRFQFIRVSLMAHLIDEKVARALSRMNLRLSGFGAESADPEILKLFKKGAVKRDHLSRAIDACTKYGVSVGASMVLGYPGESEAAMRRTIDFYAEKIQTTAFEYWETYVCQPLPGSALWDQALSAGRVSLDMDFSTLRIDADTKYFDSPWHYDNEQHVPRQRFLEILREYDLIREGHFVRDLNEVDARPLTDVFIRQYACVPDNVARHMTAQALRAWKATDGRPIGVFGAGRHTRKIITTLLDSPVEIAGIADDDPVRHGAPLGRWNVVPVEDLLAQPIGAVLVSSDAHQDRLLARLRPLAQQRDLQLISIYEAEELSRRKATARELDGEVTHIVGAYR